MVPLMQKRLQALYIYEPDTVSLLEKVQVNKQVMCIVDTFVLVLTIKTTMPIG